MFCRKGALRNFAKFTGEHLYQSLFLIKLQASDCNSIEKETLAQVFSCEFCEIFKNNFSYRTSHVAASWTISSEVMIWCQIDYQCIYWKLHVAGYLSFIRKLFFERCIVYTSKVRLLATSQQSQKPFLKAHSSVVAFAPQAITKWLHCLF